MNYYGKYDEGLVVGTHECQKMHQDTKFVFIYYVKCFNSAYNILRISEWPEILANILARNFLKQVSGSGSRGPVIELGSRRPTWWHSMITFTITEPPFPNFFLQPQSLRYLHILNYGIFLVAITDICVIFLIFYMSKQLYTTLNTGLKMRDFAYY